MVCAFANEGKKQVAWRGKDKLVEVRMEKYLFGSIFYLAPQRKIDMGEVLPYPLTPIPCHI